MAVEQDSQLRIVRLLLANGADANFNVGACFTVAFKASNDRKLEMLCKSCPPSPASAASVLITAVQPQHFHSGRLELLLRTTQNIPQVLNAFWRPERFKGNPYMTEITEAFLRHGLNINLGNGTLL